MTRTIEESPARSRDRVSWFRFGILSCWAALIASVPPFRLPARISEGTLLLDIAVVMPMVARLAAFMVAAVYIFGIISMLENWYMPGLLLERLCAAVVVFVAPFVVFGLLWAQHDGMSAAWFGAAALFSTPGVVGLVFGSRSTRDGLTAD